MRTRLPHLTDNVALVIVGCSVFAQIMFAFAGAWLSSYTMIFVLSLWTVYTLISPAWETTEEDLFEEIEALEAELDLEVYRRGHYPYNSRNV